MTEEKENCIVCTETFNDKDVALECGHWIHRSCVQKHADSMQDLRAKEGYPPLTEANCPICRKVVPGIIPKEQNSEDFDPEDAGQTIADVRLDDDEIRDCVRGWAEGDEKVPLSFYIWITLSAKYPEENSQLMILAAAFYADLVHNKTIAVSIPDTRFERALKQPW